MRYAIWTTVIATALLAPVHAIFAQAFPSKLVRIIIPFTVGGSSDHNARIIQAHLSERWKEQVIVEPHPGAATTIGTDYVAKSEPDGHTLLLTSTQYAYAPTTFARLPYDPYNDLVPVTLVSISPQMIVAHPSLPAKNPRELIALARAHPGELNLGNAGSMLPSHLFFMLAKVKMEPVPYKGAGPLMTDLMGGHVPLAMAAISSVQGAIRLGRAKIIGVCSLTPSSTFPEAPVIAKDVPGFEAVAWFGLFAPHGTPAHLVRQIRDDVAAVLQIPDVRKRLLEIGGEPSGLTPEAFAEWVNKDIARWKQVGVAAGIKPQ